MLALLILLLTTLLITIADFMISFKTICFMYKSGVLSTLDFKYVDFKHQQPVLQILAIIIYMMIQFNSDTNSLGLTQIKAKALILQVCVYFRYKPQV